MQQISWPKGGNKTHDDSVQYMTKFQEIVHSRVLFTVAMVNVQFHLSALFERKKNKTSRSVNKGLYGEKVPNRLLWVNLFWKLPFSS